MFTIRTAQPGHAYHTLTPNERLGHAVPGFGFDDELEVAVRIDFGSADDVYTVRFWLIASHNPADRREVIIRTTFEDRLASALAVGADIDALSRTLVAVVDSPLWQYCQKLESHFRALMALKLFSLPANF